MRFAVGLAALLLAGAKLPWVALWRLTSALSSTRRLLRRWAGRRARGDELACAAGHPNLVLGRWKCKCGFELLGGAFERCPSCGEGAGWFPCRVCGLGIRDPMNA